MRLEVLRWRRHLKSNGITRTKPDRALNQDPAPRNVQDRNVRSEPYSYFSELVRQQGSLPLTAFWFKPDRNNEGFCGRTRHAVLPRKIRTVQFWLRSEPLL